MTGKMVNYINGGRKLEFNEDGYAIVPFIEPGQSANGTGFFTATWRDILLTASGTGEVAVFGSCQLDCPDFLSPATIDNSYARIIMADYSLANTYINQIAVADQTKIAELNTNLLTWVAIYRTADTVDVKLTITNAM